MFSAVAYSRLLTEVFECKHAEHDGSDEAEDGPGQIAEQIVQCLNAVADELAE